MLTLGINYSQMHDSSACVVRDGELLFAVAEERLSRVKHDARFLSLPSVGVLWNSQRQSRKSWTRYVSAGKLRGRCTGTI